MMYKTAKLSDVAVHGEGADKEKASGLVELLTPICKGYGSDQAFEVTRLAIQTLGGYGYCSEYPVEQYMRDCKIASIYEETNGIQALDLLGRKVLNVKKQMKPYNDFMAMLKAFVEENKGHAKYGAKIEKAGAAIESLDSMTKHIVNKALAGDQTYPVVIATPYLEAFGHALLGWLLAEQLLVADKKLDAIYEAKGAKDDEARKKVVDDLDEAAFYAGKIYSSTFFIDTVLPRVDAIAEYIKSENIDILNIPDRGL